MAQLIVTFLLMPLNASFQCPLAQALYVQLVRVPTLHAQMFVGMSAGINSIHSCPAAWEPAQQIRRCKPNTAMQTWGTPQVLLQCSWAHIRPGGQTEMPAFRSK